jgi:hypothetical protein
MPPTVHKLLFHGADIIQNLVWPLGQLSEETQEARNKNFKRIRECHARKNSKSFTYTDILNSLLISSDPFISGLRKMPKSAKQTKFPEARELQLLGLGKGYEDDKIE